ncbi:MAG: DEAD/DEAH box helicase [Lactobacillaceae bacterium]
MTNEELLFGRQLLSFQLPLPLPKKYLSWPAMVIQNKTVICNRCNSSWNKTVVKMPDGNFYCPSCISLGRVTSDELLYHLPEGNYFEKNKDYLHLLNPLTSAQLEISEKITDIIVRQSAILLWAVTGAGKTEMMFLSLNYAFRLGLRVCWAAPRVDVILELAPRLKRAFPDLQFSVLYGQMEESYSYRQFVLCTTHQLLRFFHAFDVLIIDEVDSFPYVNNLELNFAAKQAVKPHSSQIYLSATPPDDLLQGLPILYLAKRFHGHPLPVPQVVYIGNWRKALQKKKLVHQIKQELKRGLSHHERYLIFVSEINLLNILGEAFQRAFPLIKWTSVHAKDPQRKQKIMDFRQENYDVLFTTTILERGVTIKKINVIVIGAESRIFNWATLVQIAGRAGRDSKYFADRVIFYYSVYTSAIKKAINQIKQLNQKAGFNESM